VLSCFIGYSQEVINNTGTESNEAIQQIRTPSIDNILIFQNMNKGISNYAFAQQTGNYNTVSINQQNDVGPSAANQSYTVQQGNSNEMTIGQMGNGNLLLSFQLGYLAILAGGGLQNNIQLGNSNASSALSGEITGFTTKGERNKLNISQTGNNNGVMAVQQGTDNSLSVEQDGANNYLFALQKGTNNSVTGYKQENNSEEILFEKIIQIGDYLSLKTDESSMAKPTGNTFTQTGTNLSIEVNNNLLNTVGGVEINQTGRDMKVVIDQSYFSFPMK
jgi:hypothetical protein